MMKKSIWIFFTVILTGVVGFSLYQHFNNTSNTNIISDTALYTNITKVESIDKAIDEKLQGSDAIVQTNEIAEVKQKNININNKVSPLATEKKESDTLNLRDFGVIGNGKNETDGFQKALDASAGKVLFIPKQQGVYYLTRQLRIPSNSTLVFDSKAIVQATDDLIQNHANFEVLFRIENANNVNIEGNNALFRMNKSAYKSEHNHIFMINGSSNVSINKVRANNSGGDGFYIGAYKTKKSFCENIKIYNSIADSNRRQGMSITSVKNFYAENCVFSNTQGTLPEAGVDIEPSQPTESIINVRLVNCVSNGNKGAGFLVVLFKLNNLSDPVEVKLENCTSTNNLIGFWNKYFSESSKGLVSFINCKANSSKEYGFGEGSCASSGTAKLYQNCVAENNNIDNEGPAFQISNLEKKRKKILGNSKFINCKAINNKVESKLDYGINVTDKVPFQNVIIKNFVSQGHKISSIKVSSQNEKFKGAISIVK